MDRVSIRIERIERRDLNWMVEMKILERPWIGEYTYLYVTKLIDR
jgi:hypothetical protein